MSNAFDELIKELGIKRNENGEIDIDALMNLHILQKEIPKKPKETIHGYFCGACEAYLVKSRDRYCPKCGQKINWTGMMD